MVGSSPRMRGAPYRLAGDVPELGIIPADAGSTVACPIEQIPHADHPRGCGEHGPQGPAGLGLTGSSPRMRGAHSIALGLLDWYGIIPADAGSTSRMHMLPMVRQDHPRGCGEHQLPAWLLCWLSGSSPRMRGARRVTVATIPMVRIIPADAGSTGTGSTAMCSGQDHPRGCGEH